MSSPNGAAALNRAGKGGVALRATMALNADQHAADLAEVVADIRAGVVELPTTGPQLSLSGAA